MNARDVHPQTRGHLAALTNALGASEHVGYGLVEFSPKPRLIGTVGPDRVTHAAGLVTQAAQRGQKGSGLYVNTCPMLRFDMRAAHEQGRRGRGPDVQAVTHLWADLDVAGPGHKSKALPSFDAAREVLDAAPLAPSYVIHSGGGLHAWWRLTEPVWLLDPPDPDTGDPGSPERVEWIGGRGVDGITSRWCSLLAGIAADLGYPGGVDQVGDAARVLRIAGTWNRKQREPRLVELDREWHGSSGEWPALVAHTPDAVRSALGPPPEPDPPHRGPRSGSGESGAARVGSAETGPMDVLDEWQWSDIWPDDWSYVGPTTADGAPAELWRRPGAETPHSVTCWVDGGCHVWSSNVPGLDAGRGYSKGEIYAWALGLSPDASGVAEVARLARRSQLATIGGAR